MITLATTVLACVGLQAPEPAPADEKPAAPVEATATVKTLSDDEARAVLAVYKEASREKDASLADRTKTVEALAAGSHAKLVSPLAKIVATDSALSVQRAAARALGHQPAKQAHRAILKLLDSGKITDEPMLVADLVTSLDTAGYESRDWKDLEKLFTEDYTEEHRPKQKAIITLAKNQAELDAIDLLVAHLDEPAPKDVNDPNNPPAEYWEKRWKAWQSWRADVKEALFAITGQRFNTEEEARAWLRKNRSKLRRRR